MKLLPIYTLPAKAALIMALTVTLFSCNEQRPEEKRSEDTKEVAKEQNEVKFEDDKDKEKDAKFLVNAAEINLEEIELGHLATEAAKLTDVKALGKMMETAHKKGMADLTALAGKKSITIPQAPTDKAKDAYRKLSDKSGSIKFDKEFCDMMVDGHKKAIEAFEKASTDANDPDIREWAMATLPELRMHLEHATKCQDMVKKM